MTSNAVVLQIAKAEVSQRRAGKTLHSAPQPFSKHREADIAREYLRFQRATNELWEATILIAGYAPDIHRFISSKALRDILLPALLPSGGSKRLGGVDAHGVINRITDGLDARRTLVDAIGRFEAVTSDLAAWTYIDAIYSELRRVRWVRRAP